MVKTILEIFLEIPYDVGTNFLDICIDKEHWHISNFRETYSVTFSKIFHLLLLQNFKGNGKC
jgi:hypothetical protein